MFPAKLSWRIAAAASLLLAISIDGSFAGSSGESLTQLPKTFDVLTEKGVRTRLKILDYGLIVPKSKRLIATKGTDSTDKDLKEYRLTYRLVRTDRIPAENGSVVGFEFRLPPIARGDKLIVHYTVRRPHHPPGAPLVYEDIDSPWTFDHSYSRATRTLFTEFDGPQPDFLGEWEAGIVVNDKRLATRKFVLFDAAAK